MANEIIWLPLGYSDASSMGNKPHRDNKQDKSPATVTHLSTMTTEPSKKPGDRPIEHLRLSDSVPPTKEEYDKFLAFLDSDRDKAWHKRMRLHTIADKVFQRASIPDTAGDGADIVIDRVTKHIAKGNPINTSINGFVGQVAHYVLAARSEIAYNWASVDDEGAGSQALDDLAVNSVGIENMDDTKDHSPRHQCRKHCLDKLPEKEKQLLEDYHKYPKGADKIKQRRRVAQSLNIAIEELRLQVCRIKQRLRQCVDKCCQEAST